MELSEFDNLLRSMFNIDGDSLPEFSTAEQLSFVSNPARYFMRCGDGHRAAIWREMVLRRYSSGRHKVRTD